MSTKAASLRESVGGRPRRRSFVPLQGTIDVASQILVVLSLLALWEFVSATGMTHKFLLPRLSDVLMRIGADLLSGDVFIAVSSTLYRAVAGFLIAAALGVPLGVLMARSMKIRWFFEPLVAIGFPTPKIAFLPIIILWFDVYDTSKIIMVAFASFFVIATTAFAATISVDKWPIWSARSLGASERQLLYQVIIPLASPQILTGLQIAMPVALINTIVAEMRMGGTGLGSNMINAGRFADSVGVFAGIIETAILGFVVLRTIVLIRRRLLRWHPESRAA